MLIASSARWVAIFNSCDTINPNSFWCAGHERKERTVPRVGHKGAASITENTQGTSSDPEQGRSCFVPGAMSRAFLSILAFRRSEDKYNMLYWFFLSIDNRETGKHYNLATKSLTSMRLGRSLSPRPVVQFLVPQMSAWSQRPLQTSWWSTWRWGRQCIPHMAFCLRGCCSGLGINKSGKGLSRGMELVNNPFICGELVLHTASFMCKNEEWLC